MRRRINLVNVCAQTSSHRLPAHESSHVSTGAAESAHRRARDAGGDRRARQLSRNATQKRTERNAPFAAVVAGARPVQPVQVRICAAHATAS
jgi:hypothetical protein